MSCAKCRSLRYIFCMDHTKRPERSVRIIPMTQSSCTGAEHQPVCTWHGLCDDSYTSYMSVVGVGGRVFQCSL